MKKHFLFLWPFLFIVIIWLTFSSPYFIKGNVPYPSSYQVNWAHPWSLYEKFWGPVKNGAMPDVIDQIYPWKHFTIQVWKSGQIPFWNPNSFSGNPHLANFQTAVFSPFNVFFFMFPFLDGWSIVILLQPLLAGIFMLFLLRGFKASSSAALVGAVSFMFCGFITVWMAYGTLSMVAAFLPLCIYAIERGFKKPTFFPLFLIVISLSIVFFSGHFQIGLYVLLYSIAFFLFKWFTTRNTKTALFVLASLSIGMVISLLQIIPSVELYQHSVRSELFNKGGAIPLHYLVTLFAPDFFGNPVTRNDWVGNYAEWASFVGIIPCVLACYVAIRKKSITLFFLLAALVSLLMASDTLFQWIFQIVPIPVLSTSIPSRIIVLFSFSVACLAAFGLDNLLTLIKEKKLKRILVPIVIFLIGFLVIFALLYVVKIMPPERVAIAKRNFILPFAFFVFFASGCLAYYYQKKILPLFIAGVLLMVTFDSLRFAQKWMPFDPSSLVFAKVPIIDGIKTHIGSGRIFGNTGAHLDTYYGFPTVEGYDPLYIKRYGEFIRAANNGTFQEAERSVVQLPRRAEYVDRVLDLLGVSLILHPKGDTHQSWAYPVWDKADRYNLVFQDSKFELYKNNKALPRTALFYDYIVIPDGRKILSTFYSKGFDFRNIVILEKDVQLAEKSGTGSASLVEYTPNKVQVKVKTTIPALLFLSDNFYPGWKAYVNGKETPIYRADYTFRAVQVPQGNSSVEFRFGL